MEFKQLQSFMEVVQTSSFTKAAENLYLSQPTISTHIHQLEAELNTRLVLRTTKSLEITPIGRELYQYAANILELRDRMVANCSASRKKIISLGASTIPSAYVLPEILPEFARLHPDIYFVIHQGDSRSIAEGLIHDVYDLGLIGMDPGMETLELLPFCRDRLILITPVNNHFLTLQEQNAPLGTLLREPVILREEGSGSQKRATEYLKRAGIRTDSLKVTARINDQEAIKNLVAGGLGISIISERAAANFLRERRLLAFSLPDDTSSRCLYAASRRGYIMKKEIVEFVHFLQKHFSQEKAVPASCRTDG